MIRSLPLAVLKRILENKLHAKLNVAREVALHAAGEAEARVARVEIEVNDIRVIERVERLAPELNALALADLEILRYREIDRLVRHVPQIVVCRFEVAQAKRVQPDEPGRVEADGTDTTRQLYRFFWYCSIRRFGHGTRRCESADTGHQPQPFE